MTTRAALLATLHLIAGCATTAPARSTAPVDRDVVIVVWDGLRPDSINTTDTPTLVALRDTGTDFTDHHATFPTFTMMNSASFATGTYPDASGYYGNVLWVPGASGSDSSAKAVDFRQPVFSEDYAILDDIGRAQGGRLLLVGTLFAAAQAAGMPTLTMGKNGAAYLQDVARGGMLLDEKTVFPLALAKELQSAGIALPVTAPVAYPPGELVLASSNGSPVDFKPPARLKDGVTPNPEDTSGTRYEEGIAYIVRTYVDYLLPSKRPRLTLLWLRDPDSTQHSYGVGTPNARAALRSNDAFLARILAAIAQAGRKEATDVLVVSDHGHSNVSGELALFPLRAVRDDQLDGVDADGHSVSGQVRLADLLRRAGFTAFDGLGCTFLPGSMGILRDGKPVYAAATDDDGTRCGKAGQKYQLAALKVPKELPPGALVVAVNGGSDYVYVPDHDPAVVRKAVLYLQGRSEVGPVFVDDRYGAIPGTMPLSAIHALSAAGRNPDIILSYDFDEDAVIEGTPGTEMSGVLLATSYRGMHGSFGRRDVRNTLVAAGPDFRAGFKDPLPTANVDVAPTVAQILGLKLPQAQGRALMEAIRSGATLADYHAEPRVLRPASSATGLTIHLPTDPDGNDVDSGKSSYTFELHTKTLRDGDREYTYYDYAKVSRR